MLQKTKRGTGLNNPAGSFFWVSVAYNIKNFIRTNQLQRLFCGGEHRGKISARINNPGSNICTDFGN